MSSIWPSAVATDANLYIAVNSLETNLSAGIINTDTTIPLNSTSSFPTVGTILVDSEVIKYTGISGSTLTGATRGFDGTTAVSHSSGAVVSFAIVADHHNVLKNEIEAVETTLSGLVGLSATLPLTVSKVMVTDGSGHLSTSTVTSTTLAFLDASSSVQTQLNGKLALAGGTMSGAIAMGGNNISGIALGTATTLSATGVSVPATGSSLELLYSSGGIVQAFNRTGGSAQPLILGGSSITLNDAGANQFAKFQSAANGGAQLTGTTAGDSASAGIVGQYVESVFSSTNLPSTGAYGDATSISLTAGDWSVSFTSVSERNTATQIQYTDTRIGISQTTGNSTTGLVFGSNFLEASDGTTGLDNVPMTIAEYRVNLTSTTNIYAKMQASYSGGQPQIVGRLSARRIR